MSNFIVSARKYRPSTFKTVVGQNYIVTTLKNAIKNNQLAQAFLFTGPRGVGKTTCARILAKTINCTNISDDFEACNECESCRSFNQSASFNVHELDAASNNSVDDIRSLVEQVRIPPQAGAYKIYIIDEVHMLSASAFNAFLKTLEEPPAFAKFILATTEKHKIIPTILSRCQVFDFKRIKVEDIAKHLAWVANIESIEAEPEALHIIASKSDGALRDALSIFDQMVSYGSNVISTRAVIDNLNILDYEYHFRFISSALVGDTTSILLALDEIYDKGFDGQAVISGLSDHLRALLVCKDEKTLPLLEVHESLGSDYLRQSKSCSVRFLVRAIDILNACDINYKAASNKRFHIELSLLKIAQLSDQETVQNKGLPSQTGGPVRQMPFQTEKPKPLSNTGSTSENDAISDDKPVAYQPSAHSNGNGKPKLASTETMGVKYMIQQKKAENPSTNSMDSEYSEEDVVRTFGEFKQMLAVNEDRGYETSVIRNAPFEKKSDSEWELVLNSSAEAEAFRKLEMQAWFREKLNNRTFSVQFRIEQKSEKIRTLTKEEKAKDFIKSHPEIQKLMTELEFIPDI